MAHDPKNAIPTPVSSRAVAHNQQASGIAKPTVAPVPQLKPASQEEEAPVQQVAAPRPAATMFPPPKELGATAQMIPPFQLKPGKEELPGTQPAPGQALAAQSPVGEPAGAQLPNFNILVGAFRNNAAGSRDSSAVSEAGAEAFAGAAHVQMPAATDMGTPLPYDGWPVAQRKQTGTQNQAIIPATPPIQRQVIQRVWNVDTEIGKAATFKTDALGKIGTGNYDGAFTDYNETKAIMAEIYGRQRDGKDSIFNRHTIAISGHVNEIIAAFDSALKGKMDTMLDYYKNMYITYDAEYTALYDQIAAKLNARTDGEVAPLKEELDRKANTQKDAFALHTKIYNTINKFKTKVAGDTNISYNYGKDKGQAGEINNTKLAPVSFEALDGYLAKNKGLAAKYTNQGGEIKKTTDTPEDDTQRNSTVVLLMAGSKTRKEAITALFADDVPKQISIFTQLNKLHRSDDITDVVALINAAGPDNLTDTLGLIEAVGAKGDIKKIKAFYDAAKAVTGTPALTAMAAFLLGISYTAINEVTDYLKEAGKHGALDTLKPAYAAAKTNNKIDSLTELFKTGGIPDTYATDALKIGLAFATTKGKSKAADFTKLLSVTGWDKAKLLALVMACADNDGNVTAERWAVVAQKNPTLEDKPEEVRATARLNDFANDDWYKNYKTTKLSSAKSAKKEIYAAVICPYGR